jgi:diaminopimelate decarboxylase
MCWNEARGLYLQHRNSRHIRWQGISSHIGSQIVDAEPFHEALTRMAAHLGELRKEGIELKYLDFGGGLGVRYTNEAPVSRGDYARMVAEMVQPLGVGLLLEPGRSIVASAGVLLSRVLYTKRNAVKAFVVVDAAMNDFARPVLYDAPHPITRVSVRGELATPEERVDIVGPVCESGDSFLQGWPIGHVEAGDVVAIWGAGAYGMVQASNYNGRCRPAEVMVKGKRVQLIRRRETMRDVLRTDVLG